MRSKLEDKIAARLRTTSFDHKKPVCRRVARQSAWIYRRCGVEVEHLIPGSGAKSVTAEDADGSCE